MNAVKQPTMRELSFSILDRVTKAAGYEADRQRRVIDQFIVDVRDMIATIDSSVPPHALTNDEIVAAYRDGMERRVVAENFVAWYQDNIN